MIGFTGGATVDLPGVTVNVRTPFVSLIFTPLDDTPLAESGNILITAMARDTQTGARYTADGKRLESVGGPPLLVEPVQADIKLKGRAIKEVNVLDLYGMPTDTDVPTKANAFHIDGTYRTYYYQVVR